MQIRTLGGRIALAFALALVPSLLPAQPPAGELEGGWVGVSSAGNGKTREFKADEVYLKFAGGHLIGKGIVALEERSLGFTVDPKLSPKQLTYWDLERPDRKYLCIYKIQGETLTIAVPVSTGRPTEFSDQGRAMVLLILRREPKKHETEG